MKKSLREFLIDKYTAQELRRASKNDPDPDPNRTVAEVAEDKVDDHFSYEFLETITEYIDYRLGEER